MALRSCTAREVVKARKRDRAAGIEAHAADAGPLACSAVLTACVAVCRVHAAALPSACMGVDEVLLVLHAVLDDRRSSTHGSFDDEDDVGLPLLLLLLLLLHAARRLRGKPPRALLIAVRPASSAMPAGSGSITQSAVGCSCCRAEQHWARLSHTRAVHTASDVPLRSPFAHTGASNSSTSGLLDISGLLDAYRALLWGRASVQRWVVLVVAWQTRRRSMAWKSLHAPTMYP